MRITALRADRRAPDYVVIDVDGARFASLPRERVEALGLRRGEVLEGERLERLTYLADVEAAYRVAVRVLASRPRAVQELLRRLRQRGHNPSAGAEAVGMLEAKGYLDDAAFARHFARVRSAKGHGRSRLLSDLLARGVERRVAERAVDEVLADEDLDETSQVRALAEKRLAQLGKGLSRDAAVRRLVGYLGRRGFVGREVLEIVRDVVGAGGGGED